MSDRPCEEWMLDGTCVIGGSPSSKLRGILCQYYQRCMYAAQRYDFTPEELEVLDAWSHGRLCLLAFRP